LIQDPRGVEVRALFAAAEFSRARVLEVGCGDGRLTFRYGSVPDTVIGIEPSADLLVSARTACPANLRGQVTFVQATAPALPFRDSAFDIVLFAKSL